MIRGAKHIRPMGDIRIPIRSDLLARLISYVEAHVKPYYISVLYSAAFSLAYHMCLRVSEYTVCRNTDHTILISDVFRINLPNNDNAYRIKFRSFKHCPQTFPDYVLYRSYNSFICPVRWLTLYLTWRPDVPGPLFIHSKGAITPKQVADNLHKCAEGLGWDPTFIHSHGFRIGRTTDWADEGYSAVQIRSHGSVVLRCLY